MRSILSLFFGFFIYAVSGSTVAQGDSHALTPQEWSAYFDVMKDAPPRGTTLKSLEHFAQHGVIGAALDLGAGSGTDTLAILKQGWKVLAIDYAADGLTRLQAKVPPAAKDRLTVQEASFESLELPSTPAFDWINASFSLPFCSEAAFPQLWEDIVKALKPGGVFSGQLFGDRDSWRGTHTTHTRTDVEKLLLPFDLLSFEEREYDAPSATGPIKHWHVFHIVAKKK